jgi:uncharacterized membrane protein HdeD (DUF308 family)
MLGRLGEAWAWILAFGIITVLTGVIAVFWPAATLLAIAVIFAIQLIISGVFRFVASFAVTWETGWLRALTAVLAVISFIVGVYLLGHLVLSVVVLAVVLGIYWMAHGVVELFLAFGHPELTGRGWIIGSGVLGIVAGAILVLFPTLSLFALTVVLGVWLVIFGASIIGRALQLRSATHAVSSGQGIQSPGV